MGASARKLSAVAQQVVAVFMKVAADPVGEVTHKDVEKATGHSLQSPILGPAVTDARDWICETHGYVFKPVRGGAKWVRCLETEKVTKAQRVARAARKKLARAAAIVDSADVAAMKPEDRRLAERERLRLADARFSADKACRKRWLTETAPKAAATATTTGDQSATVRA